ncbi:MAG: hypothetical protein HOC71_18145, partial [Candidatus Latescibacteria bacterium]|nr:hypothetical protein [Candidatus Latescibacterota bacterium]
DNEASSNLWNKPVVLRIEYGWGQMSENQIPLDRIPEIYDWDFTVSLDGAKIAELQPCWQSAPLAEDRRHSITKKSTAGFTLQSYTSRQRCLFNRDTHSMALRIQGSPGSILSINVRKPEEKRITLKLSDLLKGDEAYRINRNSLKIHRIIPELRSKTAFTITDDSPGDSVDWYYIRVAQKNGQLAWSSPIWVEKRV